MNARQQGKYNILKKIAEDEGWKVISDTYTTNRDYMIFECPKGHQRTMMATNFQQGWRCAICSGKCKSTAKGEFEAAVKKLGYTQIGIYVNTDTPIELCCPKGHPCFPSPYNFKKYGGCRGCAEKCPIEGERTFREKVKEVGYLILGNYKNNNTKILLSCDRNHQFSVTPDAFKNGHSRCNICSESSLEHDARIYLENHDIKYQKEYRIPQLPMKRFDFYFVYGGRHCLLECDGEQHFTYNSKFYASQEEFDNRKDVDRIKTLVAYHVGYYIIRIHENFKAHLDRALEYIKVLPYYVSDNEKYQYLLTPPSKEAINDCPFLSERFNSNI